MKHLKYFETYAEYKEYYKSGKMVTPNICGIKELNSARFFPYVKTATPKVKMLFDATDTNLRLFNSSPKNMAKLTIDGKEIEFKPTEYSNITINTYASNIQVTEDTILFPKSYVAPLTPSSYMMYPMDPTISIKDMTYICEFVCLDGETYVSTFPISAVTEALQYDLSTNSLRFDDYELSKLPSDAEIGFIFINVNEETEEITFIDTIQKFNINGKQLIHENGPENVVVTEILSSSHIVTLSPTVNIPMTNDEVIRWIMKPQSGDLTTVNSLMVVLGSGTEFTGVFNYLSAITESMEEMSGYITTSKDEVVFSKDYIKELKSEFSSLEEDVYLTFVFCNWDEEAQQITLVDTVNDVIYSNSELHVFDIDANEIDIVIPEEGDPIINNLPKEYIVSAAWEIKEWVIEPEDSSFDISSAYLFTVLCVNDAYTPTLLPVSSLIANGTSGISINNNSIIIEDEFLTEVWAEGTTAVTFILCGVDIEAGTITYKDSKNTLTCGNINTIEFNEPGLHTVEMELINGFFETSLSNTLLSFETENLTEIGPMVFNNCHQLSNVKFNEGITYLGSYAFNSCIGLKNITLPRSLTNIGPGVFSACTALSSVEILGSVSSISNSAFTGCISLRDIKLPKSVKTIESGAFYKCHSLSTIELPSSLTNIEGYAFYSCYSLNSINIPDSVSSIGSWAFYCCSGLTSISFGKGLTAIGYYTFSNCKSLENVIIPDNITTISGNAFSHCSKLQDLVVGSGVSTIISQAFSYCPLKTIQVSVNNATYESGENYNCVINKSNNTIVLGASEISIPSYARIIGQYAFEGNSSLISFDAGNYITTIEDNAFKYCSNLEYFKLGPSASTFSAIALAYCDNLSTLIVDENNVTYDSRDNSNCVIRTSDNTLIRACKTTVIPETIDYIGGYAYGYLNNLTSVVIPDSVSSIESYAFYYCEDLNEITIGSGLTSLGSSSVFGYTSLKKITCYSESEPSVSSDTFLSISNGGTLYTLDGIYYSNWMSTSKSYLGYYNWSTATAPPRPSISYVPWEYSSSGRIDLQSDLESKTVSGSGIIYEFNFHEILNTERSLEVPSIVVEQLNYNAFLQGAADDNDISFTISLKDPYGTVIASASTIRINSPQTVDFENIVFIPYDTGTYVLSVEYIAYCGDTEKTNQQFLEYSFRTLTDKLTHNSIQ